MRARSIGGVRDESPEGTRVLHSGTARACVPAPFGSVRLYADGQCGLTAVDLSLETACFGPVGEDPLIEEAARQLQAYFLGAAPAGFSVPILAHGTTFQRGVWEALRAIPLGLTLSYGALAAQLGTSARAIAGACRANPVPLLVPCHRIVGERGMGGYCGETDGPWLEVKAWLLRHEQSLAAQ